MNRQEICKYTAYNKHSVVKESIVIDTLNGYEVDLYQNGKLLETKEVHQYAKQYALNLAKDWTFRTVKEKPTIINKITKIFKRNKIGHTPKEERKGLPYAMAEYKYVCHLKDHFGLVGEIEYPNEQASKQHTDGTWLLLSITGVRLGTVSNNGIVRTTWSERTYQNIYDI